MLGDPDVWLPAIHGGALSGYDPDARINKPMIILQADPQMGPALFPDHAARQHDVNPEIDIRLIEGRAARDSFVPRLARAIRRSGA